MQIVIDVLEDDYEVIKQAFDSKNERNLDYWARKVAKGTPLPEHGRLIDADVLVDGFEDNYEFCEVVNATPTILEASKE